MSQCVVCGGRDAHPVWSVDQFPLLHFRARDSNPQDAPFVKLGFVVCDRCGHLYNAAFDPGKLEALYSGDAALCVPVTPSMLQALDDVAQRCLGVACPNPSVLEVGGSVGALSLAIAPRARTVDLVEPSAAVSAEQFVGTNVTFHRTTFPAAVLGDRRFDLVICRQVADLVAEPMALIEGLHSHLAEDGVAYVEVSSGDYVHQTASVVDLHYQHINCFRRAEFEAMLARAGFAVVEHIDIKNGHDQGFVVRRSRAEPPGAFAGAPAAAALADRLEQHRRNGLDRLQTLGGSIAIYGANAYSQALLGLYPALGVFTRVFDDTALIQGDFVYGAAEQLAITAPSPELLQEASAIVIAVYLHDVVITRKLRAMGFRGPILTARPGPREVDGEVIPSLFA